MFRDDGSYVGTVTAIGSATAITSTSTQVQLLDNSPLYKQGYLSNSWLNTKWGTENQLEWETAIRTPATITTVTFWAGLKLTSTPVYATDSHQAYFLFATDTDLGDITTLANLHFIYSVEDTDYITNLGIALAASTNYKLRIKIDSDRKISIYVNNTQYGLVTSANTGGATQSTATQQSNALTNDKDLTPFVGIKNLGSANRELTVLYEKISRLLFE